MNHIQRHKKKNLIKTWKKYLKKVLFIQLLLINHYKIKKKDEMMKKVREQITVLKKKEAENKIKKLDIYNEIYFKDI